MIVILGQAIIWIIMICVILGGIGAIRDEEKGIGKEFMTAFHQLGIIFIPFAGMLAAMPYIEKFVLWLFGGIYTMIGADVSMAGGLIVAPDMGGYQLTESLAGSPEMWIMALFVSYMSGPIICYSIPMGFSIIPKRDHKYFGLGIMAGVLSIPFAVLACVAMVSFSNTPVRDAISNNSPSITKLMYSWGDIWLNLLPIIVFCVILAVLLRFFQKVTVKAFLIFGRALGIGIKVILIISIVEYFTGFLSKIFPWWGFSPIIADEIDQFRALENAGYIVLMLAGAYPMIYLINKYCSNALTRIGAKCGFTSAGSTGIFATCAEQIAMFGIFGRMAPADKVKVTAFSVCGSWILGAHISITANFQPNILIIILIGKIFGGIVAIFIAKWLAVPVARKFEENDRAQGIIRPDEYRDAEDFLIAKQEKKAKKKEERSKKNA